MRKMMQGIATCFGIAVASPAFAQGSVRYELLPEPDVKSNASHRTATAYVIDKKENQFLYVRRATTIVTGRLTMVRASSSTRRSAGHR
jgi:hypothetical protein